MTMLQEQKDDWILVTMIEDRQEGRVWESDQLADYCNDPLETCVGSEGCLALHSSRGINCQCSQYTWHPLKPGHYPLP